jgi:hypothetical protein
MGAAGECCVFLVALCACLVCRTTFGYCSATGFCSRTRCAWHAISLAAAHACVVVHPTSSSSPPQINSTAGLAGWFLADEDDQNVGPQLRADASNTALLHTLTPGVPTYQVCQCAQGGRGCGLSLQTIALNALADLIRSPFALFLLLLLLRASCRAAPATATRARSQGRQTSRARISTSPPARRTSRSGAPRCTSAAATTTCATRATTTCPARHGSTARPLTTRGIHGMDATGSRMRPSLQSRS